MGVSGNGADLFIPSFKKVFWVAGLTQSILTVTVLLGKSRRETDMECVLLIVIAYVWIGFGGLVEWIMRRRENRGKNEE